MRTKARTRTALQICRACFACWDAIPIPVNITSRDSRALLRSAERAFCRNAKPASHDAEQQVWAVPNKLLQGKGLCIYKDIACKRASAYQNGTTKHCLQKLLHPSELSIPLAAVILDSSKIFQEAVAVTAKQVQIGDRSCRTYGADCAEYLLLQMTDEHELQPLHRAQRIRFCSLRFRWKAGTMHYLRGKPLLCGESKGSAARLRTR